MVVVKRSLSKEKDEGVSFSHFIKFHLSHRHKVKEKRKLFGFLDVKIVSPISTFVLNKLALK